MIDMDGFVIFIMGFAVGWILSIGGQNNGGVDGFKGQEGSCD